MRFIYWGGPKDGTAVELDVAADRSEHVEDGYRYVVRRREGLLLLSDLPEDEVPTGVLPAFDPHDLSELDRRILLCQVGEYPWDEWEDRALAAGVPDRLAALGRLRMHDAYRFRWPEAVQSECGWDDDGAKMIWLALADPVGTEQRWLSLPETVERAAS